MIVGSGGGGGPVSGPLAYFAAFGGLYYSVTAVVHCARVCSAWLVKRDGARVRAEIREIESEVTIRRR